MNKTVEMIIQHYNLQDDNHKAEAREVYQRAMREFKHHHQDQIFEGLSVIDNAEQHAIQKTQRYCRNKHNEEVYKNLEEHTGQW